jgi:hypothetical protein
LGQHREALSDLDHALALAPGDETLTVRYKAVLAAASRNNPG